MNNINTEISNNKDLAALMREHSRITMDDVKKHLAGPLAALVIHIIIIVIVFNIAVGDPPALKEKNVTVEMKEMEKPPEIEKLEVELHEVMPEDIPEQTEIFTPTETPVVFSDETPVGEISDVLTHDTVSDIDLIPTPVVIASSNSSLILKNSSPFGSQGGGGGRGGDGSGGKFGNMLQGIFYDLKQLKGRKGPSGVRSNDTVCAVMQEFVNGSWTKKVDSNGTISYPFLDKFYSSSVRLWNSCFYIPLMPAENAPAAYGCEKEVATGAWVAIYSGKVIAPVTGRIRFVGGADDLIAVRFDNKLALDYGYFSFSLGVTLNQDYRNAMMRKGTPSAAILESVEKLPAYADPVKIYNFTNSPANGFATGRIIEVQEGQAYDIEIMISEMPGGVFHAGLFIEYMDDNESLASYDSRGNRILPLFSTNGAIPAAEQGDDKGKYVPFSPDPRIWRTVPENYKPPKKIASEEDLLTI